MSQANKPSPESQTSKWKKKGNRALLVNIIFFFVLLGSIFLIALASFEITLAVILVVFVICIVYIYFS